MSPLELATALSRTYAATRSGAFEVAHIAGMAFVSPILGWTVLAILVLRVLYRLHDMDPRHDGTSSGSEFQQHALAAAVNPR